MATTNDEQNPLSSGIPELGDSIPRRGNRLSKAGARAIMQAAGWQIIGEIPDEPKLLLVGAPHTSNWDYIFTILTTYSLGCDLHYVAKHSLFKPPLGGLMRYLGGISIERGTAQGFVNQMVAEFNRREQFILAIMPEGTRDKVDQRRSGFYHIALGAGVPIVLVIFDYGRKIMHLGPTIWPTGDYEADLAEIQSYFASIRGKYAQ
jgi:1-acyl-sn-glycerol-3-phosphate acyltransferase